MHPILVELGGITLYSFGLMMALAFLAAFFWTLKRAKAAGEDETLYITGVCWLIFMSLLGARLFYFVYFPQPFLADPLGSLLSSGGLVWYGGMIAFSLTLVLFTRLNGLSVFKFSDIVVPPAALGLAIGRIGCFLAGCCYGGPCDVTLLPWAVQYPAGHETHPLWVHPAPLYATAAVLTILPILLWVDRHKKVNGETSWWFVVLYGIARFLLEYARGDRLIWLEGMDLSASQVISFVGVLLGVGMLWWLRRKQTGAALSAL
ncbi:MAG: prolipoprotein diacylglyceryl transferase [Vampirovibrio sp.]|nr:prolipoprotein diacylglyceryl transferase [Vampirovibrio sp.]